MLRGCWLIFCICLVIRVVRSDTRQGCSKLNFCGDGGKCPNGRLNYFRATGQNDSLHYAWSTVGYPTLFISQSAFVNSSDCTSSIHVNNYSEFKNHQSPGSVSIDGARSNFSFALVFKSIIEFQVDSKKLPSTSAFKPDQNNYPYYDLSDESLNWSSYSFHNGTLGMDTSDRSNMSVRFLITPRTDDGYEESYAPKPWFTADSVTFDMMIHAYPYNETDKRLAVEVEMIRGLGVADHGSVGEKYSKDDEYTPSVFYTNFFAFGGTEGTGYVLWKPITYLNTDRVSSHSQQANCVKGNTTEDGLPPSLALAIYGNDYSNATKLYIVFGTEKDDSALNNGFYTWTGTMGYGAQPEEHFSVLVILVLVIGLGIPAGLTVLAVVFVVSLNIYKLYKRRSGYRAI